MSRQVSIALPTYNRPGLLALTLASVAAQTYREFDVLVCDNGNDPATAAVVAELGDDRFTYLGREENLGLFGNAFDAMRRLEGDVMMELDDDDVLYPHCLETLVAGFDVADDITLTWSDLDMIDTEGHLLPEQTRAMAEISGRTTFAAGVHRPFTAAAAHGIVNTVSALVRRDAVRWDLIPEQVGTAYDLHIAMEAAADGAALWYTPEHLAGYRLHATSDSFVNARRNLEGGVFSLRHALASGRHEDTATIESALVDLEVRLGREQLRAGDRDGAVKTLRRTFATTVSPRALKLLALAGAPTPARERFFAHRAKGSVDPTRGSAHST